jgi:hypothetical protein
MIYSLSEDVVKWSFDNIRAVHLQHWLNILLHNPSQMISFRYRRYGSQSNGQTNTLLEFRARRGEEERAWMTRDEVTSFQSVLALAFSKRISTSEIGRKGGLAWMMGGQNILLFNFPFHALLYLRVTYYPSTFLFTNLLLQAGMLKGVPLFLLSRGQASRYNLLI